MGFFEQVAVADLKLGLVLGASILAFAVVFVPLSFVLQSKVHVQLGVVLGVIAAVATGYVTATQLV